MRMKKKAARRRQAKLKEKARKTELSELLQIIMMKAYILAEEKKTKSGAGSSTDQPWTPANPKEAFDVIHDTVTASETAEVAEFAKELQDELEE